MSKHSNRSDDKLEIFNKRLEGFRENTKVVQEYFESHKKWITLDSEKTPSEIIDQAISLTSDFNWKEPVLHK